MDALSLQDPFTIYIILLNNTVPCQDLDVVFENACTTDRPILFKEGDLEQRLNLGATDLLRHSFRTLFHPDSLRDFLFFASQPLLSASA